MKPLLIKNGRVIDPASGLDARRDLLIDEGRIAAIAEKLEQPEAEFLDASNCVVAPGFVDMHVHLREPGKEGAETIQSGTQAAAAGGFTAVACMPNTQPVNDAPMVTRFILGQAEQAGAARVYPVGAVTKASAGEELAELESLRAAGVVAVSDDGQPVYSTRLLRRALEYCQALNMPLIDHCEEPTLAEGGVMHEGEWSLRLGLRGQPALAEVLPVLRNARLAAETDARVHIAHLSTRAALEVVRRAKQQGVAITCDVTPHHFSLTDAACCDYDTNFKMNPPLRTAEDVAALVEGLADGTVDAIASDHAPHKDSEKQTDFDSAPFGIIGLETALALALEKLYHTGKISLTRLVELFSTAPARILGVPGGRLQVGAPADITVFDLERKWTYRAEEGVSKSRNTPFDGWSFRGGAVATVVNGRIIFHR
ncbi:MAG TPA: dihydroorotase [Candidatus Acidoferrales bacterium]|nr:dihydroorotase [Candidatus Acidoferrales bacterium]